METLPYLFYRSAGSTSCSSLRAWEDAHLHHHYLYLCHCTHDSRGCRTTWRANTTTSSLPGLTDDHYRLEVRDLPEHLATPAVGRCCQATSLRGGRRPFACLPVPCHSSRWHVESRYQPHPDMYGPRLVSNHYLLIVIDYLLCL